ncbi:MAG: RNA polymerase sigma factor RpoD/SigA [Gemmatimonas sp.]|nr:RNA polymerase sigma factor RpoD/SigA [Gemmatimonadaceae bacterium]
MTRQRRPIPADIRPAESDRDILDQYFAEVSQFSLLTADGEKALARRIRSGDHDAMEELVRRNLRFVVSVAKKYQNRGMALIDLIGEGNVGLMTAARKFDPDQGVKFISYAVWWIRQAILAALARQGRTVRVPLNRTADLSRVVKAIAVLREKLEREPTPLEISHVTGISTEIVGALSTLNASDVRLDASFGRESDRAFIERFAAEDESTPEGQLLEQSKLREVERALLTLPPRDARILRLYFGLEEDREHTLDEIGKMLGVTRERVRQLRDRALKRLRQGAIGEVLRDLSAA